MEDAGDTKDQREVVGSGKEQQQQKNKIGDFAGSPVVENLPSNGWGGGAGWVPG